MAIGAFVALALALALAALAFGPSNVTNAVGSWNQEPCAVNANGDAALDLVGLMATPGREGYALVVVDGASGATLWTGPSLPLPSPILCPTADRFVVEHDDFAAGLYRAANTALVARLPLSDKVTGWAAADDCVTIAEASDRHHGFRLADGQAMDCAATPTLLFLARPNMARSNANVVVTGPDGSRYLLTAQSPGTPFLTVAGWGPGGEESWSNRLRFAAAGHNTLAMAMADGVLVVYGGDATDDDSGVLIGLDPVTGRERYAIPQESSWGGDVRALLYNGRYIVVFWESGLHAYDPATGDPAWNIGGT